MDEESDSDRRLAGLMRRAQDGDGDAYRGLLREILPMLRRTIRRRRGFLQAPDREDLVQDVLLSLHAVRATYDPGRPFLPWLMTIVHNRVVDGARRHARRAANETNVAVMPETFVEDGANTVEVYGDPEALNHAIEALPGGQREAIRMLKLREMSLKEASALSGMSVAALKVAVHRAVKALRRTLSAEA